MRNLNVQRWGDDDTISGSRNVHFGIAKRGAASATSLRGRRPTDSINTLGGSVTLSFRRVGRRRST